MKTMINKAHVEGYLYEHSLEVKVSGPNSKKPGTEFITGEIKVATDENMTNIIPIHFTYVTENTSTGKPSATYAVLKNIIDGKIDNHMNGGKEKAGKLRIDTAIALNEFYTDRSGKEELVSARRYEGGFIHLTDVLNEDEKERNTFEVDMLINSAVRKEADEEKNQPEKMILKGAIFDFRKSLLPIEFTVLNPRAMDYFESMEPTQKTPVFTKLYGRQISETVVKRTVEESAFGEDIIKESKSTRKDFVITNASKMTYELDTPETITVNELNEAVNNREIYLATVRKQREEYKASKNNAAPSPAAAPAKGAFNF